VGKPERNRQLGRPKHTVGIILRSILKEIEWMDRTDLAKDRDKWWVVVNAAVKVRVP